MTHFLDLLNVGALEIRTDTGLPSLYCLGEGRISTVGRRLSLCCVPDDLVLFLTRLLHDDFLLYNGRRISTRSHSRGLVLIAGAGLSFAQGGGICERTLCSCFLLFLGFLACQVVLSQAVAVLALERKQIFSTGVQIKIPDQISSIQFPDLCKLLQGVIHILRNFAP